MMDAWLDENPVPDVGVEYATEGDAPGAERYRLRNMRAQAEVDLHGMIVEDALARLDSFLRYSQAQGLRKVRIVHGKGNHSGGVSVVKKSVRSYLQGCVMAGEFGDCAQREGGKGATWVVLRSR